MVIEEKLLQGKEEHPFKIVGWQGIWGVVFSVVILTVF